MQRHGIDRSDIQISGTKGKSNMNLFLNERDGDWEVWRGEDLSSARLVRVFGSHAEALAFYDENQRDMNKTFKNTFETLGDPAPAMMESARDYARGYLPMFNIDPDMGPGRQ